MGQQQTAAPTTPAYTAPAADTPAPGTTGSNSYVYSDTPTAFSPMPDPPKPEPSGGLKVLQAICWYLPNRLMDITDIPRFYLTIGDGQGASVRATKYLTATWFEDEAYCLGWTKRTPPWFGEQVQERYFGFLAAQEGDLDRDPTELGLSLHLIVFGANAALSAGEFVDALTGIVGIDLAGDDHGPFGVDHTQPDADQRVLQQKVYGPQGPSSRIPPEPPVTPATPAEIKGTQGTEAVPPTPAAGGTRPVPGDAKQEPALPGQIR